MKGISSMNEYTVSSSILASIDGPVAEKTPAPPSSNTGGLSAKSASALVDALTFTFGNLVSPEAVRDLPEFAGLNWLPMEKGDLGYKAGWFASGISILFDGTESMGTHVRLMGQACRFLEGREEFEGWHQFLHRLLRYKLPVMAANDAQSDRCADLYYPAKVGRLDVAIDDDGRLLNLGTIQAAASEGTIVSTYRKGREIRDFDLKNGENSGQTLYFGKRTGDSMIRFYDRAAKMGLKDETCIRCELELHDEQARAFCEALLGGAQIGQLTAGVIRRKLDFKAGPRPEQTGGSQYRAWVSASWWDEFLCGVEKMRLGVAPIVRTLQKGKEWLLRQAAPLIATVLDLGEMMSESGAAEFLADVMTTGRQRRPSWQKKLFEAPVMA
jgi:hypothetical protein